MGGQVAVGVGGVEGGGHGGGREGEEGEEGEGVGGCGETVGYRSAGGSRQQTHGLTNNDGEEENI